MLYTVDGQCLACLHLSKEHAHDFPATVAITLPVIKPAVRTGLIRPPGAYENPDASVRQATSAERDGYIELPGTLKRFFETRNRNCHGMFHVGFLVVIV